ncbi:hypothetical protein E0J20_09310 [Rhizobium leguminosarum bv. viciae]|nr:hypothetical protein E0J20_09310 [Rhizobium leguminosarum bv. viciae]
MTTATPRQTNTTADECLYIGLSNIELDKEQIEFSRGIAIESTFAHLMSPMMLAFARPSNGGHHPGPWKSILGGSGTDITAQIKIPISAAANEGACLNIGSTIVSLLRLRCDPAITMTALSRMPFEKLKEASNGSVPVLPLETTPRHFPLQNEGGQKAGATISWVASRLETVLTLRSTRQDFQIASAALDGAQFIQNDALALISLWGALEALFSPSTGELRFRVSALIAAYLHEPGQERADAQKRIALLYDKRSAAAHGKPRHVPDDLVASFNLLRSCLMKMISEGSVPTKEQLEGRLFGLN